MTHTNQPKPMPTDHPPYWSTDHPDGCPSCTVCVECCRPRPTDLLDTDQVCDVCRNT